MDARRLSNTFISFLEEAKINIYDNGTAINILELFSFKNSIVGSLIPKLLLYNYVDFNGVDELFKKYFGKYLISQPECIIEAIRKEETCLYTGKYDEELSTTIYTIFVNVKIYKMKYKYGMDIFDFIPTIECGIDQGIFRLIMKNHNAIDKLCFSIYLKEENKLQQYIKQYNPCNNNFRAYRLAKYSNKISNIVLNRIITFMLLYKYILVTYCSKDIFVYVTKLL